MDASKYVKPTYSFREIMELQKLPLTDKVAISCEALRRAFRRHKPHLCADCLLAIVPHMDGEKVLPNETMDV